MSIIIRDFKPSDCEGLVKILKANGQYKYPAIDGPEAMLRVHACEAALFLVAEEEGRLLGLIRGVYDGSRALIHEISVHPDYQRKGIGTQLVREMAKRFEAMGAPTISVTAAERSLGFWEKLSFKPAAQLLIAWRIDEVIEKGVQGV